MKKTLIALAVAASAVVSGSAMAAWVDTGTGGVFNIGGVLTPKDRVTPWEANVYPGLTSVNANIEKGKAKVEIPLSKNVPVVSIRNREPAGFRGGEANAAMVRISFGNAVDIDGFSAGVTQIRLKVVDSANSRELGTLTAPFFAGGLLSLDDNWRSLVASSENALFWGGLGKSLSGIASAADVKSTLTELAPDMLGTWKDSGRPAVISSNGTFELPEGIYRAVYGAGFKKDARIAITLNAPLTGGTAVNWKAEFPITISYS